MLSAAHDILKKQESANHTASVRQPISVDVFNFSIGPCSYMHEGLYRQNTELDLFPFLVQISVTLPVDFQGTNSSNSSRYDCNPVSTAVNGDSLHTMLTPSYSFLTLKFCERRHKKDIMLKNCLLSEQALK